ncbi:thiamine phosphate synthase [Sagittula stellata]|uniref:Thiamine-phosphate synthase n=1 Tax=Sagittula stellata (strain ATCC 700073 / DSM 11524 / E-37) TaxID=388399 RepID=A3K894_SAGS3|nr:thiamine phosphate synthase [Sagittula stellata]EBA06573.1 Thiamine-phosphate pyrophosphorylase [Sagittula stellata E-37]
MIPPLCFVTEASAPAPVPDQATAAARGGAGWVQLRDKTSSDADLIPLAQRVIASLAPLGARLIVNDRVDVAIAAGAYGLHIGQGDGDPAAIRARIGPDMFLGLSIEHADQLAAVPKGVDYLGVGPVYATGSKPDHAAPIGLDGFAQIAARTALPCLAIGGLTTRDAAALKASGGAGMAVVSAISRAADMTGAARALCDSWRTA